MLAPALHTRKSNGGTPYTECSLLHGCNALLVVPACFESASFGTDTLALGRQIRNPVILAMPNLPLFVACRQHPCQPFWFI